MRDITRFCERCSWGREKKPTWASAAGRGACPTLAWYAQAKSEGRGSSYLLHYGFFAGGGFQHGEDVGAGWRVLFAHRGQGALHRVIVGAGDEEFVGGEARDDLVARFGDDDFFFDAGRAPAVLCGPEGFEREDHAGLDFVGVLQRNEAADDGLFPDRKADAVAVLQAEGGFFVGEAEFLRFGPDFGDFAGLTARAD